MMPLDRGVAPLPGVFSVRVDPRDKHHLAGKPAPLMRQLVEIVTPGGVVLDPFAGSGSTGVAAIASGRSFLGAELDPTTAELCRARLEAASQGLSLSDARAGQLGLLGDAT